MASERAESQTAGRVSFSFHPPTKRTIAYTLLIVLAVFCAYATTFAYLVHRWSVAAEYSHGYLVPIFSLAILWFRCPPKGELSGKPSRWAFLPMAVAVALYVAGTCCYFTWFVQLSLLPALAAVILALGGWKTLRWTWLAIAFLLFMIPLPARLDQFLAGPLQRCATLASANALQTFGLFAHPEGNVILMSEAELGVVEACSGLRMLMVFFAASTAVAIIQRRSLIQTGIILLSAIPIALLCNVLRITITGILQEKVGSEAANVVFHDVAGWFMIPLALLFLYIELWFLSHVFVPKESADPKRDAVHRATFGFEEVKSQRVLSGK